MAGGGFLIMNKINKTPSFCSSLSVLMIEMTVT